MLLLFSCLPYMSSLSSFLALRFFTDLSFVNQELSETICFTIELSELLFPLPIPTPLIHSALVNMQPLCEFLWVFGRPVVVFLELLLQDIALLGGESQSHRLDVCLVHRIAQWRLVFLWWVLTWLINLSESALMDFLLHWMLSLICVHMINTLLPNAALLSIHSVTRHNITLIWMLWIFNKLLPLDYLLPILNPIGSGWYGHGLWILYIVKSLFHQFFLCFHSFEKFKLANDFACDVSFTKTVGL